ncbi:dGTP triphosphohydrolase [uncultured Pseudodesulfovibrio sp.]|uniref:dGTP triphosphohydrolase n=1 Tax=uncultured Pseudodesulfovibrio sp. TaxID=2035858 RepID=UPI0029C6CDAB|nr:dNTP triphosphohydrolase [uncultured Pseudodesulfovibrio sp.]
MGSAPRMDWNKLLDAARYGRGSESSDIRSPFQRDIDRIMFSDHFRRLARKTQVHPLNENDHIHSRLTHSLEVASVGKSLGELAGVFLAELGELPGKLGPRDVGEAVQAACLAHDIGNPPFGHSGESAIKDWFANHPEAMDQIPYECRADFTKFDGNAMAIRILLNTGFYRQGMSPTHAVAGALLKYPWPSSFDAGKDKFSYFQTEARAVQAIADRLGLIDKGGHYARHPLAFLMEAADDICYRIIDMEDATELGILPERFMFDHFAEPLGLTDEPGEYDWPALHFRQRNSILRAKLIHRATNETAEIFKKHYEPIMNGEFDHTISLMGLSEGISRAIYTVYKGIEDQLFLSRRKIILELGAQNVIGTLLDLTMAEAKKICTGEPSTNKQKVSILLGESIVESIVNEPADCHYKIMMAIVDYVSGMTDHYATDLCRKFMGLGF